MEHEEKEIGKNLKLLARTSFVVFMGVALSKIFTYLYKIIIARGFGPEVYGLFTLGFTITSFFVTLSLLGLSEGLLRYAALYKSKKQFNKIKTVYKFVIPFSLSASILFGIIMFFSSNIIANNIFHNEQLVIYLKVMSISVPLLVLAQIYLSLVRAFEHIKEYSFIMNILQSGIRLLIIALLVFFGVKGNVVLISFTLGTLIFAYASFIAGKRIAKNYFINIKEYQNKKEILSPLWAYSWPILFLSIISMIFFWIDSLSIGYFRSVGDVGIYSAAVSIIALLGIAPDIFMQLFFPLIMREYARKRISVIRELSKQITKWVFLLNIPLLSIMFFFPGVIINILFGAEYLGAENALRILVFAGFVSSVFIALESNLLSMKGKSKLILINLVFTSILNLILNILWIPKYGIDGAAYATLVSTLVLNGILFIQVWKSVSILPIRRKMLNIVISAGLAIFIISIIEKYITTNIFGLIMAGMLFLLLYFVFIIITGTLDRNDRQIISSLYGKMKYIGKGIFVREHRMAE